MVRFGIVGTGGIAAGCATDLAAHPDAELIAVADPSRERVTAFADRFGVGTVRESAEQLVALEAVDAVYVAVPNFLHAPISTMALQAGKHVIQEKPLALSLADAAPLAAAARQSGRCFMLGMNQRFAPAVQRARQLMAQGRIGRPYHCKAYWRRRAGIPRLGSWFTRKEHSGGGGLLDIGVHMLDDALYLLDDFDVHSVSGATYAEFGPRGLGEGGWGLSERSGKQFDVDDFATALIRLRSGASVALEAIWAMHAARRNAMNVELYGPDGAIDTYGERLCRQQADGYHVIDAPAAGELTYPHASRFHHFVNVILGREQPCVTLDQALAVQRVLDAIYASAGSGREVIFEAAAE